VGTPIVFPNPAVGNEFTILIPLGRDSAEVRLKIFTTAYRKVADVALGTMAAGFGPGNRRNLPLRDSRGRRLANGVYYLVVTTEWGTATGKMLVLK